MSYDPMTAMRDDIMAALRAARGLSSEISDINCLLPASVHRRVAEMEKALARALSPGGATTQLGNLVRDMQASKPGEKP